VLNHKAQDKSEKQIGTVILDLKEIL